MRTPRYVNILNKPLVVEPEQIVPDKSGDQITNIMT